MIFAPQVSKFRLVTDTTPSNQFSLSKILTQQFQAPIKDRIKSVRDLPMVEYKRQRQEIIPFLLHLASLIQEMIQESRRIPR